MEVWMGWFRWFSGFRQLGWFSGSMFVDFPGCYTPETLEDERWLERTYVPNLHEDMFQSLIFRGVREIAFFLRELPFPRPIILGIYVSFWVCKWMKQIQAMETDMAMENPPWMKMYFLLKLGIFQCHVCFQQGTVNEWMKKTGLWLFRGM